VGSLSGVGGEGVLVKLHVQDVFDWCMCAGCVIAAAALCVYGPMCAQMVSGSDASNT
jgi:hypothetical protein